MEGSWAILLEPPLIFTTLLLIARMYFHLSTYKNGVNMKSNNKFPVTSMETLVIHTWGLTSIVISLVHVSCYF